MLDKTTVNINTLYIHLSLQLMQYTHSTHKINILLIYGHVHTACFFVYYIFVFTWAHMFKPKHVTILHYKRGNDFKWESVIQ